MPVPKRKRMAVEKRRDQLLDLARQLFGKQSFETVAIDDIAAAAGISRGLLYHYFPSKRDLYIAALERAAAQLLSTVDPAPCLPAIEQARQGIHGYLAFVDTCGTAYAFLLRSAAGRDSRVFQIVERARDAIIQRIARGLGVEEMEPILRTALRGWLGTCEGACLDWLEHRDVPRHDVAELLLAALVCAVETAAAVEPGALAALGNAVAKEADDARLRR